MLQQPHREDGMGYLTLYQTSPKTCPLEILKALPPEELADLSFYSADISALYTNLSIEYCIDAVISIADEHWDELSTFGITLVELHKILELVFHNTHFLPLIRYSIGRVKICSWDVVLVLEWR